MVMVLYFLRITTRNKKYVYLKKTGVLLVLNVEICYSNEDVVPYLRVFNYISTANNYLTISVQQTTI